MKAQKEDHGKDPTNKQKENLGNALEIDPKNVENPGIGPATKENESQENVLEKSPRTDREETNPEKGDEKDREIETVEDPVISRQIVANAIEAEAEETKLALRTKRRKNLLRKRQQPLSERRRKMMIF